MTKDEKLSKVVQDFSMLPEEKQNYVLGILQALVFAGDGRVENATAAGVCHEETSDNTQK